MIETQVNILEKYRLDDNLVTKVEYTFTGDLTGGVTVEIFHFRPSSEADVTQNIFDRGESEKIRLIAQQKIDEILNSLEI